MIDSDQVDVLSKTSVSRTSNNSSTLCGYSNGLLGIKRWRDFVFPIVIIEVKKMESIRHRVAVALLRGSIFFPKFGLRGPSKRLAALVDIPVNFAALVLAANRN